MLKMFAQHLIKEVVYQSRKFNKPENIVINKFKKNVGYELNLNNPKTFNEKLQWLKLYDNNPEYTTMVDKYEVRKYIKEKVGEKYLIPLIGVYDKFDDINFESLPNQFVLKTTHDSGGIVICTDKKKLDLNVTKTKINKCLKKNYYYYSIEWPYKNVNPKIVCEKYMVDESGKELKDYKIFCFNGEPKYVQVDFDRFTDHRRNFYDLEWNLLDFTLEYKNDLTMHIERPKKLPEMIEIAKEISNSHPFTRIDLYSIENQIYFGEITFFPDSGYGKFSPEVMDYKIGDYLILPRNI